MTQRDIECERQKREATEFVKASLKKADEKYNTLKSETQALEKLLYVKCRELYKLRVLSAAIL